MLPPGPVLPNLNLESGDVSAWSTNWPETPTAIAITGMKKKCVTPYP